jgi:hypothetical protein
MFNDPYNFSGNQNGWPNTFQQTAPQWGVPQLKTNKVLVTSLEEAISRSTDRYSEMYYFDQNKPVFYIVRTDMNLVKSWVEIPYIVPNQENNTPATKADLADIEKRLGILEAKSNPKKKKVEVEQEVSNVESTQ